MAQVTEAMKLFIVQHLAEYYTPQEVADAVGVEFGVVIDRRQVEEYDPEKRCRTKKWCDIHAARRKAFVEDTSSIGIAQPAFRLREMDRLYRKVSSGARPNIPLSKELLVEAEKFNGKLYTNRRELTGKGGEPIVGAVEVRFVRPKKADGEGDGER